MKLLIFLIIIGAAAYYYYESRPEPPPPLAAPAETPAPPVAAPPEKPLPFTVKTRVKKMIEEWKRISLSTNQRQRGAALSSIEEEMLKVREELFKAGQYDVESLRKLLVRALGELGHAPDQATYLARELMSQAPAASQAGAGNSGR